MGKSAFGTLLKRGDGALRTLTFASVAADETIIIEGVTFTAHATTTTVASREFDISGDDTADASEFASLVNDSTYGITGLTASAAAGVVTLINDGIITDTSDSLDTITGTAVGSTVTDASATETFTTLGEVTNIDGPGFGMETIDTTNHSSPSAYREQVPSFKTGGEVTAELNFDPTSSSQDFTSGLLYDFENRTLRNFQIVYPTSPVETFALAAYVSGFSPSAPVDGKLSASVTLATSGAITQS